MILIKSLVVLFLLLLIAHYYKKMNTPKKKEGFTQAKEEEEIEKMIFKPSSSIEKHAKMAVNSQILGELSDKMNELLKLNDIATEVNETLK
jgi:hypothetical protein